MCHCKQLINQKKEEKNIYTIYLHTHTIQSQWSWRCYNCIQSATVSSSLCSIGANVCANVHEFINPLLTSCYNLFFSSFLSIIQLLILLLLYQSSIEANNFASMYNYPFVVDPIVESFFSQQLFMYIVFVFCIVCILMMIIIFIFKFKYERKTIAIVKLMCPCFFSI